MLKLVLTVMADPALKQSVEKQLKALAFDVMLVSDAESAIHELGTRKPHLVCIDDKVVTVPQGEPGGPPGPSRWMCAGSVAEIVSRNIGGVRSARTR